MSTNLGGKCVMTEYDQFCIAMAYANLISDQPSNDFIKLVLVSKSICALALRFGEHIKVMLVLLLGITTGEDEGKVIWEIYMGG